MNQLVEGVLAIGAGLPPNDRAGAVIDRLAVHRDAFAVAFHVALLEIIGEKAQGMVVRQQHMRFGMVKIVIPNAEQGHDNRNISLKRGVAEMFIDLVRP